MRKVFVLGSAILIVITGCKTPGNPLTAYTPTTETVNDMVYRKPVIDRAIFKSINEVVPLDTVYIVKDTLNIITKKILGCSAESFKLMWNGAITATQPHKAEVKLLEVLDPSCRERHRFHLTYRLNRFQSKKDTVTMVTLGGWKRDMGYAY